MNRINAILVDDEPRARRVLRNLIDSMELPVNVMAECANLPDAVAEIKKYQPHLVFLDVEMPQYAGYEIVNFFDSIPFDIIFVTAYDTYAVKAFEICAIDYLIKPIDRTRLREAVQRVIDHQQRSDNLKQYNILLESIKQNKQEKIVLPELGQRNVVNLKDILAIEAEGAYSTIHMVDRTTHTVSKNLKYFENVLSNAATFYRCHRGWIINTTFLERMDKSSYTLYLNKDFEVKISRTNVGEIANYLLNHL